MAATPAFPPPPLPPALPPPPGATSAVLAVVSNLLLFALVACLAACVDVKAAATRDSCRYVRGVGVAMGLQFVALPLIGFLVVKACDLDRVTGIMVLVVTASPGGSYSNWWCSLMNADLTLSVMSTTASTIFSTGLLPLNLIIYLGAAYDSSVVSRMRLDRLYTSVGVVTAAVLSGLGASHMLSKREAAEALRARGRLNLAGNLAGVALIGFSIAFSSSGHEPIWSKPAWFYPAGQIVASRSSLPLLVTPACHRRYNRHTPHAHTSKHTPRAPRSRGSCCARTRALDLAIVAAAAPAFPTRAGGDCRRVHLPEHGHRHLPCPLDVRQGRGFAVAAAGLQPTLGRKLSAGTRSSPDQTWLGRGVHVPVRRASTLRLLPFEPPPPDGTPATTQ